MLQTVAGPPAWEEVERWGSPRNILKKEQGKEQDEEVGPSQNFRVRRDSEDCVGSKLTCSLPSTPPLFLQAFSPLISISPSVPMAIDLKKRRLSWDLWNTFSPELPLRTFLARILQKFCKNQIPPPCTKQ